MASTVEAFKFEGPAGWLEALWKEPEGERRGSAVVAHAHPLHGGTMHFKVVFRMARALSRAGYGVLRFNFRGVGASQGVHDEGRGEKEDVRAAMEEALARGGGPVVLGGFSFGSTMAMSVGWNDSRVAALVGAGVPLSRWSFRGIGVSDKPALFVSGERDEFGNPEALREGAARHFPGSRVEIVPGADHFFSGALDDYERRVAEFLGALSPAGVR